MRKIGLLMNLAILFFLISLISLFLWQRKINLALKEELDGKSQALKEAKGASLHLEELERQSKDLKEKGDTLYKMVPSGEKQPLSLIKMVTRTGRAVGLREISFEIKEASAKSQIGRYAGVQGKRGFEEALSEGMPMQENIQTTPIVAQASSGTSKSGPKSFYLEMNFESTFVQLLNFLERLNNLERLVTIEEIKIERSEKTLPYQKISLQLVTYAFLEQ